MADKHASMYKCSDGGRPVVESTGRSRVDVGWPGSGVRSTGRGSYVGSGTRRAQSNPRYSATDGRDIGVNEDRIKVLDRKIEGARRDNAMMRALYESDRVSAMATYCQRAGELNSRIASTYFKPLYAQQVPRSDSFNFQKGHQNHFLSSQTNNRIHLENSRSRLDRSAVPGTSNNMFIPNNTYSTHQHSLKPASFVDATRNVLDTSTKSKSFNGAEARGKSTRSVKSNLNKKKNVKSVLSTKGNKSTQAKKGNKSTISKAKNRAVKDSSRNVSVAKSESRKVNTRSSLVNPLISRMSAKGTGKALPKSKLLKNILMNSVLKGNTISNKKAAMVSAVGRPYNFN